MPPRLPCVFFSEYSFLFKSQLRRSIFIRTISTVIRWSTQDPNRRKQVNVLFVCWRINSETSRPPSNDHLGPKTIERRREIVLCVVLYSLTNVRHRAHQLRVKTTYVQHFRERATSKTTTVHGYLSLQYSVFRINIINKKPPTNIYKQNVVPVIITLSTFFANLKETCAFAVFFFWPYIICRNHKFGELFGNFQKSCCAYIKFLSVHSISNIYTQHWKDCAIYCEINS